MSGLKDFQRDTVDYILERYFGSDPTRRFLVADETGLGKSVVAGGLVAELIERLNCDDSVQRIDIVYICSNQDIAAQNLARLAGPQHQTHTVSSRLTLLGLQLPELRQHDTGGKPVNFVSFTPGTSFDKGWRTGKAEERALLYYLLKRPDWDGWQRKAALRVLQCTSRSLERFQQRCDAVAYRADSAGFEATVLEGFQRRARERKLLDRFQTMVDDLGRRTALTGSEPEQAREIVGELRGVLAQAGVDALEPDLIVLDEFQRFRHLLDRDQGGEAAELAHHLFSHPDARVLLLSATPYKPFTYAEESATDDHHADLNTVLRFLCADEGWNSAIRVQLSVYRDALVAGADTGAIRAEVRRLLLRVMCRTERPAPGEHTMLSEHITPADDLDAADIRSFVAMKRLGTELGAPVNLDYWKSAPYFLNFVEGYQLGHRLHDALQNGPSDRVRDILASARLLDPDVIVGYGLVDLGNSKLRKLADQTVGQDWWQLLWMPPSLQYYRLGEPFARAAEQQMTKRLVFSSWNATPTAVSALLSYEAERRVRKDRPDPPRSRLDYRTDDGKAAAMSTLVLFWPHPGLAYECDPQAVARTHPDRLMSLPEVEAACRARLGEALPDNLHGEHHTGERQPWRAVLRWPGALPSPDFTAADAVNVMQDPDTPEETYLGLQRHVEHVLTTVTDDREPVGADPVGVLDELVPIGMHAPGNVAWRALRRLVTEEDEVTPLGLWSAAAVIGDGLRSVFNRPDSMALLDRLDLGGHYWQAVLQYCAAGGLQAVLDEYLHVLHSSAGDRKCTDDDLWHLASTVWAALTLRPAPYVASNPLDYQRPIRIMGRFALRYGGRTDNEATADRTKAVRQAFNSPFWPFVVSTTSAGQEGIDFHTYCSAVVHWNTPANPVDFEQREGRVHRFGGHAVRRNVAARHRAEALCSPTTDVWKAAYDAARETSHLGDLMPYWVYPGPATIERHLLPLPLSRDLPRYRQLQRDLALYRLTFGQPRQEDMLTLLASTGRTTDMGEVIDLRPPGRT
ncbi:helicase-related protein [Actinoplanes sp. GCM10030250]|uniref:helicase-related protein n=1 Tax=Actinoplanes sp. GCM10030250 TaxID=3273376 RepID=UPI0036167002